MTSTKFLAELEAPELPRLKSSALKCSKPGSGPDFFHHKAKLEQRTKHTQNEDPTPAENQAY